MKKTFTSPRELFDAADQQVKHACSELKPSVFYYFVARYLVVLFEAANAQIPLQVWNEYRNALDHFMRHATNPNGGAGLPHNEDSHIQKMERHLLRATLDTCKLLTVKSQEKVAWLVEHWGKETLDMIDGGRLYLSIENCRKEAIVLLEQAKATDFKLGGDFDSDKEVILQYLEALFKINEAHDFMIDNNIALNSAKLKLSQLKENFSKKQLSVNAGFTVLGAILGTILGKLL